jgi:hypothetical protein
MESSFSWNVWTVLFFIFERIGVLMQRWRIIVVIGGWMVVSLMTDEDQVHRASLVWKNDKYVNRFG